MWERERKIGEGGGGGERKIFFSLPRPPPLRHSVILAPILPVCSESKIAANHSIDLQNRLHCRLDQQQIFFMQMRKSKAQLKQWKDCILFCPLFRKTLPFFIRVSQFVKNATHCSSNRHYYLQILCLFLS